MAQTAINPVLQRKLAARQTAAPGRLSAARALARVLPKVSNHFCGLPLRVGEIKESNLPGAAVEAALPEAGMLMLLEAPDGARGAAVADTCLVTALIQQQTMGAVQPVRDSAEARGFTRTDAAMTAPWIDTVLAEAAEVSEEGPRCCLRDVGFGAVMQDRRVLALALEAERYRGFAVTLMVGAEGTEAVLNLYLPIPAPPAPPEPPVEDRMADRRDALRLQVMDGPVTLSAILCRFDRPLSEVQALRPGEILVLPNLRLDQTRLETPDGSVVSVVQLGQMDGMRAVRGLGPAATGVSGPGAAPPPVATDPSAEFDTGLMRDPAPSEPTPVDLTLAEDEGLDDLSAMSVDEAAAEISELAGLDLDDALLEEDAAPGLPAPRPDPGGFVS